MSIGIYVHHDNFIFGLKSGGIEQPPSLRSALLISRRWLIEEDDAEENALQQPGFHCKLVQPDGLILLKKCFMASGALTLTYSTFSNHHCQSKGEGLDGGLGGGEAKPGFAVSWFN